MTASRLGLTRQQILAFRRRVGGLDKRLPPGQRSLRRAAWAGLQDSMPRAALLSIHARIEGTEPTAWEDPFLVQLWGPRYNAYVVAARDRAVFTLGRLSDETGARHLAEDLAARPRTALSGERMALGRAGRILGGHPSRLRYTAPTGTVLMRWDGARLPIIWTVPPPDVNPRAARLELARRYLHIFGPATPNPSPSGPGSPASRAWLRSTPSRGRWSECGHRSGESCVLAGDEPAFRTAPRRVAPARLLPSGDAYFLLQGDDRELLVPDADHRRALWTPRVWPGAVLVEGEIVGTWRRSQGTVTIQTWRRLSRAARETVEAEAASLPIPGIRGQVVARWDS